MTDKPRKFLTTLLALLALAGAAAGLRPTSEPSPDHPADSAAQLAQSTSAILEERAA